MAFKKRNYNDFITNVGDFNVYQPAELDMPLYGKINLSDKGFLIDPYNGNITAMDLITGTPPTKQQNNSENDTISQNIYNNYDEDNSIITHSIETNSSTTGDKKYAMNFFYKKLLEENKGKENAEKLSSLQAAGIVGNLIQESGLNTRAKGDNGKAIGIAQWHPDRQIGLKDLAKSKGTDIADFDTQLEYIWKELKSTESKSFKALLNSKNIKQSTIAFMQFERPGNPQLENRIRYAESLLS